MSLFPFRLYNQWQMMWRCVTYVGMGIPDLDVQKFKFLFEDCIPLEKDKWLELYDIFKDMLHTYLKYQKDHSARFEHADVEFVKEMLYE